MCPWEASEDAAKVTSECGHMEVLAACKELSHERLLGMGGGENGRRANRDQTQLALRLGMKGTAGWARSWRDVGAEDLKGWEMLGLLRGC